jgi:DNA-binding NarL/FixJ family response regulator
MTTPAADASALRPRAVAARSAGAERHAPVGAPIRVVVGKDDLITREGVVQVLRRIAGIEVLDACADLPSLRDAVEVLRPDVVLTDVRLPPSRTDEGIQLGRELRATHPATGVIVFSQDVEPTSAAALLASGSSRRGYLLEDRMRDADGLRRALRDVAMGGSVVDTRVVDEMLRAGARGQGSAVARLTPREHEILALVARGLSNASIGRTLGIARRTVERHINGIYATLQIADGGESSPRVKAALLFLAEATHPSN